MSQPWLPWTPWLWPFAFSAPMEPKGIESRWATPNVVVTETQSVRLRRFGAPEASAEPILIVAPYAIHGAGIVDFAEGHSLVATLMAAGLPGLYVLERRSATPEMRFQTIDDSLADLNVAVDDVGGRAQLVGVCQGGWLSLAYAARFPRKAASLVLAGAPVDTDAGPSGLVQATRAASPEALQGLASGGDGLISGVRMLAFFESAQIQEEDVGSILQDPETRLGDAYAEWNKATLDLPGRYWLQSAEWLFRENRLARGAFAALGRTIRLKDVTCPLFILAGADDPIAPPAQAFAARKLVGTPAAHDHKALAPCAHLSLFLGAQTLRTEWAEIALFLGAGKAAKPGVSPPSGSGGSPSGRRSVRPARKYARE